MTDKHDTRAMCKSIEIFYEYSFIFRSFFFFTTLPKLSIPLQPHVGFNKIRGYVR